MPNRIIKESICTSDDFAKLSWFEQSVFIRLIVTVDDFGRMDARPAILRGRMFPLNSVVDKQIADALAKLSTVGMVDLYSVGGKPYLQLTAWNRHQTPRAKDSKYPAPDNSCDQMQTDVNICEQTQTDVPDIRYSNTINDIRYSNTNNAPARHKYGEYQNVLLSDDDMDKLKSEFPNDYEERIERLSSYIASTGKSYKNHLATIRNWARKDGDSHDKRAAEERDREAAKKRWNLEY